MLAIVTVWSPLTYLWILPFLTFIVTGFYSGWISFSALLSILILAATVRFHCIATAPRAKSIALTLLIFIALVFAAHLPPGFKTLNLWPNTTLSAHTGWSSLRFTADKPLLALFLLLSYRDSLCRTLTQWADATSIVIAPALLGIIIVYLIGLLIGYVVIDISFSSLLLIWFFRNLLFTVVAEEIFFRLVIQSRLESAINHPHAKYYALGITAVFFGVVHLYAGWQYGLLATLSGITYGYAYLKSRRVEMAMLAHILLNFGHVSLMSYPSFVA